MCVFITGAQCRLYYCRSSGFRPRAAYCILRSTISVYLSSPKLLHSETLEGMRKWHLGKHSRRGPCSCSGWCPRHSPHVRWSCTSILAFYWHGRVTGVQRMPAELQPELVNIYFQACRCQRWSLRIYFCGALSEAVAVKVTDSFF